jgi:hypothetical protein
MNDSETITSIGIVANNDSKKDSVKALVQRTKDGHLKPGSVLNPKGSVKGARIFSLREDLINSLKRLKHKNPKQYRDLIDSYWLDPKYRQFCMEVIDGKPNQRIEQVGSLSNPIRTIEVKQLIVQTPNLTLGSTETNDKALS